MAPARLLEVTARLVARLGEVREGGLRLLSDEVFTSLLSLLGEVRRVVDAIGAEFAAELERRSAVAETSLSRKLGERTPAVALARLTGIDPQEAQDWCTAGAAASPGVSLTGELLPPRHEAVARSLTEARLTPRAVRSIVGALDAISARATVEDVAEVEHVLLDYAPGLTSRELAKLCRQVVDRFDPDGVEPREQELRARSGITVINGRDGLITWIVKMHPEAAGLLTAAVDARTAPRRTPTFVDAEEVDQAVSDTRALPQKRLDALVSIAKESLGHDTGRLAGTAVTMCVTMTLDSLMSGVGSAHIDGIDEPISASTARRLAADAAIIPVVLGGDSEPLDVGTTSRLFTEAQRRALAIRDGGCVWTNCGAPPGWCEVAHLTPWSQNGPTDLANGALMCAFHHRRFDNDGWALEWRGGVPWLVPPAWVDAAQTPRRAGRLPRVA
jgi:hypothetical protein